jgi:hypothetical protein
VRVLSVSVLQPLQTRAVSVAKTCSPFVVFFTPRGTARCSRFFLAGAVLADSVHNRSDSGNVLQPGRC